MTDTLITCAPSPEPKRGLRLVAVPLTLFLGVLAALLALSWYLLVPHFTRMEVAGSLLPADEVPALEEELSERVASLEARRTQLVLPTHDAAYDALTAEKRATPSVLSFLSLISSAAKQTGEQADAFVFHEIRWNRATATLTVRGDVRNVGARSMTVLAGFVEALRALPEVASLTPPPFAREEDPKIGPHSPFALSLILHAR